MNEPVNITPTPRILRVLGDLPFQPWQCFAELIDNSIDAFKANPQDGECRIDVQWSRDTVAAQDRTIEIRDNAIGMSLEQMTNAVKAGYSNNDPIGNLGLFGMGFNIATAKLGDRTTIFSSREGDSEWIGIEIDFANLIKNRTFNAPVVSRPKEDISQHGTIVEISNLNNGIYASIKSKESSNKKVLENIYAPLLTKTNIDICLQGKKLVPKRHCVWGESRFILRDGKRIYAVQKIDRVLGNALFDIEKNKYLTPDEEDEILIHLAPDGKLPLGIVERQKRLKGWVGIQRYFDTSDFGIDFVRNGRKILISNKDAFSYINELTGTPVIQYPVELGTTVGGRIVGEVEVDYLIPTYQKNGFDTTDISWQQTMEALRGKGPILPRLRKSLGYMDENSSPCGLLANAYRRTEKGSKNLALARDVATDFYKRFQCNDPDYQNDDIWWKAVLEADRENASGGAGSAGEVDSGETPSDDPTNYIGGNGAEGEQPTGENVSSLNETISAPSPSIAAIPQTSEFDYLLLNSKEIVSLSGTYSYDRQPPFSVRARETNSGIQIIRNGLSVACVFFMDGVECDFIYNPKHELLSQYPNSPKSLLLIYLAQKFSIRDVKEDILSIYSKLTFEKMKELKIDKTSLQEQVTQLSLELREMLIQKLESQYQEVILCIKESSGEQEEMLQAMGADSELINAYGRKTSESIRAIEFVPLRTIIRIVGRFPDKLFDGQVFKSVYTNFPTGIDEQALSRLRENSKERVISWLRDALAIQGERSGQLSKDELSRYALSVKLLRGEME